MSHEHDHDEEMMPEFAKVGQKVPPFTMETFDPTEGRSEERRVGKECRL